MNNKITTLQVNIDKETIQDIRTIHDINVIERLQSAINNTIKDISDEIDDNFIEWDRDKKGLIYPHVTIKFNIHKDIEWFEVNSNDKRIIDLDFKVTKYGIARKAVGSSLG